MKLLALLTVFLSIPMSAQTMGRLDQPELATVLGLQEELAPAVPRAEQPYFVRIFSVPVGLYECSGTVESCPDVRLFVTVSSGDLGETPALFEIPPQKGWEFVEWATPSGVGENQMASFIVRTAIPESNIDLESRRTWRPVEYVVLVSTGSASYMRR